jgi:hypothetical protein
MKTSSLGTFLVTLSAIVSGVHPFQAPTRSTLWSTRKLQRGRTAYNAVPNIPLPNEDDLVDVGELFHNPLVAYQLDG